MKGFNQTKVGLRTALLASAGAAALFTGSAIAQDGDIIVVTGTRVLAANVVSASPVLTVGQEEINWQQTPEIERLFRNLPITVPGDGQNVNNGTAGVSTINLRNLGTQRSLVMIDGVRMVPYDINGRVDVGILPINALEKIDIVTGGASAVYGSDAMAGAVNFILRKDFSGVEASYSFRQTEQVDGRVHNLGLLLGANLDDDRGNVMLALQHTKRDGVQLGDRSYGEFGVSSTTGVGLSSAPPSPDANCDAPGATTFASGVGSTTAMPTAFDLPSGTLQYRNDGTLGDRCSRFNFNPFNYYQTPLTRYSGIANANYEINDNYEVYARALFSSTSVRQQVAPSGIFGTPIEIPLMNPFLGTTNAQVWIDEFNAFVTANPALATAADPFVFDFFGVNDLNGNNVFDLNDSLTVPIRRRTLELGTRSTGYSSNTFQMTTGLRGDFFLQDWRYDVYIHHAETFRSNVSKGYTNVANARLALNTVSATQCETPGGTITNGCVPLDLFGGYGTITPAMALYSGALAIDNRSYEQNIFNATFTGPINALTSPFAESPTYVVLGGEYRDETGASEPDECWKLPPASCLGGAGGNRLPVVSGYSVEEVFGEAIIPLVEGRQGFQSLSLELGGRLSNYDPTGQNETWKAGLIWVPMDGVRFRYMEQKAVRAPNVAELGSPITTALANATFDPCSVGNPNAIDATLAALCVSTGVPAALVGTVPDIVSGQINVFAGTDPTNPPAPETARTRTLGVIVQPWFLGDVVTNPMFSIDYYDIEIVDTIGTFSANEALNNCYVLADAAACAGITRISGSLGTTGAGVNLFTTNLDFSRAEGFELAASGGFDLGKWGELQLSYNANLYQTQENQSSPSSAVIDCKGFYGTSCNPTPSYRHIQRTTWSQGPVELSLLWRHIGEMEVEPVESAALFAAFRAIDAYDYFDVSGAWDVNGALRFTAGVRNVTEELPPIIGNNTGTTSFNNGNTFPSIYDVFGRVYTVGVTASF